MVGSTRVPTTALAVASAGWATPPPPFTASVKPTGRGKPATSHTAWMTAVTLKGAAARERAASAKPGGKVGIASAASRSDMKRDKPQRFPRRVLKHSVIRSETERWSEASPRRIINMRCSLKHSLPLFGVYDSLSYGHRVVFSRGEKAKN